MRIAVIGSGYVGLVSGACLAAGGHQMVCVDLEQKRVDEINAGRSPIYEKGLPELLAQHVAAGRLRATTDLGQAVAETDLSLIAVGTPLKNNAIDLSHVRAVCRQIGAALAHKADYHVVVVKSTVVPGTIDQVVIPELERGSARKAGADFGVGMNPEFLREGEAIHDFMHPDRIVLGALDERSLRCMEKLYAHFDQAEKVRTNTRTAEMIKYASNALLATMISFSNEIGNLCGSLGGIDVVDVMKGVHLDKRLSPILADGTRVVPAFTTYLEAGCGFGGSCFPKDVKALISHGRQAGLPMPLLDAVMQINDRQPDKIMELIEKQYPVLGGVRVSVLGLTFKPGTDDIRESPAIPVIRQLLERRAAVTVFDPVATDTARKLFGHDGIAYSPSLEGALTGAEIIVLLTRWEDFKRIPDLLANRPDAPLVIDGRRMLAKTAVRRYAGIGLNPSFKDN